MFPRLLVATATVAVVSAEVFGPLRRGGGRSRGAVSRFTEAVGKARQALVVRRRPGVGWRGGCGGAVGVSAGDGREAVAMQLQEVVRRRDKSPFASAGRAAAALEASDLAVELQLAEHRLDGHLALAVERAALGRGEHAAHKVIAAAGPPWTWGLAQAGVGWDEDLDAVVTTASIWRWCQ